MEGSVAKKSKSKKPDRFNGSTTAEAPNPPARRSKNTAVYVSRLPPDVTVDELRDAFSKFGLIEIDDKDEPKIKLYADPQGNFNGEALVVYFKEESVDLVIRMLDDAELRLGEPGSRMAVRKAEFGHKEKDGEEGAKAEYKPRTALDKKKATRRIGKMQRYVYELWRMNILVT